MANGSYSLLGPMNTRPYALGERPGPSTVPTIPLMSGQEAFDSLDGYYRGGSRMDSLLNPHTRKMLGGPRGTNMPNTKIAELYKLAGGKMGIGDMIVAAIAKAKAAKPPAGVPAIPSRIPGFGSPRGVPPIPSKLPGFGGRAATPPQKVWPPAAEVLPSKALPTEGVLAHAKPKPPAPAPKPYASPAEMAELAAQPLAGKYTGPAVTPPGAAPITPRPAPTDASGLVKKLLAGVGLTGAGTTAVGLATSGNKGGTYTPPKGPTVSHPPAGPVSSFVSNHGGKLLGGLGLAGLAALAYSRMNQQPDEDEEEIVAEPKRPRVKVASMKDFAEQHQFVAGFLARCVEEDLDDYQIAYAVKEAAAMDPRIARRFKQAGIWDSLKTGVGNAGTFLKGGVTALGGGLGTALGSVGSLGARVTDGVGLTDNLTQSADKFTQGMVDATHSGMATAGSALSIEPTTPDQAAKNWQLNPGGNTQSVDAMRADHNRQLHSMSPNDTLLGMKPSTAAGVHGLANDVSDTAALMAVTGGTPAANIAKGPAALARMVPFVGPRLAQGVAAFPKMVSGLAAVQGAPGQVGFGAIEAAKTGDPSKMVPDAYTQGSIHPDKAVTVPYEQGGQLMQTLHDGRQVPKGQVGADGLGPAPGKSPSPPNPAQVAMNTDGAKQLVTSQPEQAQKYLDQATSFVTEKIAPLKKQVEGWLPDLAQGKTPQELAATNTQKLQQSFGDKAIEVAKNMDPWQHVALWGGLSLGAIGVISALTDENGGIGGWLMALLGLGAAAGVAGHEGLLGQGAQDLTQGLTDGGKQLVGAGGETTINPAVTQALSNISVIPDAALPTMLGAVPAMSPDLAKQLDRAAGVGSWGNQALSALGGLGGDSGLTSQAMQKYGIPPDQVPRILASWRQMRKAG